MVSEAAILILWNDANKKDCNIGRADRVSFWE
jgi:hypothetical protein